MYSFMLDLKKLEKTGVTFVDNRVVRVRMTLKEESNMV